MNIEWTTEERKAIMDMANRLELSQLIECLTSEFKRAFPEYPPTDPQNMIQLMVAELIQARAIALDEESYNLRNGGTPLKCTHGDHLVFVRQNGNIVAHYSGFGVRCPGSEQPYTKG